MIDLSVLNPTQREAVLHEDGPLLILAGAGSGKTRVLTHRIAYLIEECGVNPYSILAITFTNKAAKEMRNRVDRLVSTGAEDVFVSTFHSMCARFLRRDIDRIGFENSFSIYDTDDQKSLMREICKALQIDTKQTKERVFLNAISDAKNNLITPERYSEMSPGDYSAQKISKVYAEYQRRLKQNNALDFDDLLMKTVELFREAPDVLERYRRRFRYIMVDEYQDTNHAQFELMHLMAERIGDDGEIQHNLCVVGDDDQSIYAFRGADIRNILDFEQHYPDAKVIKLEQNYRSTQTILDVANGVISYNIDRKDKSMWTENPKGNAIRFITYESDIEEAKGIAGEINKAREKGVSLSDYAVLYRTNAQSRLIEEQMVVRGIPYKLVGGVNFYSRMEVKDILSYLKTIENGLDALAVKRILNVPKRGIGLTTIDKVEYHADLNGLSFYEALQDAGNIPSINAGTRSKIASFVRMIEELREKAFEEQLPVSILIKAVCEACDYYEYLDDYSDSDDEKIERRSNIDELINKAVLFEEALETADSEALPLSAFLQEISLVSDIDQVDDSIAGVTLMTLHSAKGLEFPNVYICGMEEDIFPGRMVLFSDSPDADIEEERRLFYVGITRAMNTLTLTCAGKRMIRGELTFPERSRFIKEIPRQLVDMINMSPGYRYMSDGYSHRSSFDKDGFGSRSERGNSAAGRRRDPDSIFMDQSSDSVFMDEEPVSSFKKKNTGATDYSFLRSVGKQEEKKPSKSFGSKSADSLGYTVGDTVSHPKFGEGKVTDITAGGKDFEVSVDFPGVGIRKMLSSFAHLKKI